MSAPADSADRDEQMLARLAELGRTYQRLARSLRQTLALKARLKAERERARREAAATPPPPRSPQQEARINRRVRDVYAAVEAVVWAEHEAERLDFDDPELVLERLLETVNDEATDDGFADEDFAAQVARICGELDLPAPDASPPPADSSA